MLERVLKLCICTYLALGMLGVANAAATSSLPDFSQLVEKTSPAVVSIITFDEQGRSQSLVPDDMRDELERTPLMDVLEEMFGDQLEQKLYGSNDPGLGSGSIVSEDGYIITNLHVIEGSEMIFVQLKNRDEYKAQLVGYDVGTDLALLKINAQNLPVIPFAKEPAKVGQWVVAIGAPFGFEDTLTVGVISAKRRSLGTEKYVPFLQSDVAINPGNSGGPLLNLNGEMVGINAQIVSESGSYAGLSFAVPTNIIHNVMEQIKLQGFVERGWLGLAFQDLNRDLASSFGLKKAKGALVSKVIAKGPADKAGIQIGDVIVSMNQKDIRKATDVPPVVGLLPIGSKVTIDVIRKKQKKTVNLTIERSPSQEAKVAMAYALPKAVPAHGGIKVRNLDRYQDDFVASDIEGVMVVKLQSKAWKTSGLRQGDVIMRVNDRDIANTKEFYRELARSPKNKHFSLLITRNGVIQRYVAVKIPE